MDTTEMIDRLKTAQALLDEVSNALDDKGSPCACCGFVVRSNFDDYQGKQAISGASNRREKLVERLVTGNWQGRELAPVVTAETMRGAG
jgi:hypothetical protein